MQISFTRKDLFEFFVGTGCSAFAGAAATALCEKVLTVFSAAQGYSPLHTAVTTAGCFFIALIIDKFAGNLLSEFQKTMIAGTLQAAIFYSCAALKIIPLTISPVASGIAFIAFVVYKISASSKITPPLQKRNYYFL